MSHRLAIVNDIESRGAPRENLEVHEVKGIFYELLRYDRQTKVAYLAWRWGLRCDKLWAIPTDLGKVPFTSAVTKMYRVLASEAPTFTTKPVIMKVNTGRPRKNFIPGYEDIDTATAKKIMSVAALKKSVRLPVVGFYDPKHRDDLPALKRDILCDMFVHANNQFKYQETFNSLDRFFFIKRTVIKDTIKILNALLAIFNETRTIAPVKCLTEIPLELIAHPRNRFHISLQTIDKCRRYLTASRLQHPYTADILQRAWQDENFTYHLLARAAVLLCVVADSLRTPVPGVPISIHFEVKSLLGGKSPRKVRTYIWSLFSTAFKTQGSRHELDPAFLHFLAHFHPFMVRSHVLASHPDLRRHLTPPEVRICTSSIDVTPNKVLKGLTIRGAYDKERKVRLKAVKEEPRECREKIRGYFYHGNRITERTEKYPVNPYNPALTAYATWLQHMYTCSLEPTAEQLQFGIAAFVPERPTASQAGPFGDSVVDGRYPGGRPSPATLDFHDPVHPLDASLALLASTGTPVEPGFRELFLSIGDLVDFDAKGFLDWLATDKSREFPDTLFERGLTQKEFLALDYPDQMDCLGTYRYVLDMRDFELFTEEEVMAQYTGGIDTNSANTTDPA